LKNATELHKFYQLESKYTRLKINVYIFVLRVTEIYLFTTIESIYKKVIIDYIVFVVTFYDIMTVYCDSVHINENVVLTISEIS